MRSRSGAQRWTWLAAAICLSLPLRAQTKEHAKAAADGLVAALNAKDPNLLRPLLSDQCTVPGLAPRQFAGVLDRVVATWTWQIAGHRVEVKAPGRVLVTFVATNRGEWGFTMQLDAVGKIVELPLFTAEVQAAEPPLTFAGPDTVSTPLVQYGELWSVRASIDGKEGLWLIDSGAPRLVVNASGPADLPARRDGNRMPVTFPTSVSGTLLVADVVDVDTFAIGSHVATKLQAQCVDLAHLTQMDNDGKPVPFMGLIGMRELAAFEARFDFAAATLTLVKLDDTGAPLVARPAALAERHDFELRTHLPALRFAAGDTQLTLVLDTGAARNLLRETYLTHPALDVQDVTTTTLKGISADAPSVKTARVDGLSIDGRRVPPMQTVFADAAATKGTDGIVGLSWIAGRSFALNYKQQLIVFGPRRDAAERR